MASRLRRQRVRAIDVVGVPMLPPPALTRITTRLRGRLASVHRAIAPPPLRIVESLFGLLDHAALVALCGLDIPDRLDGPITVRALATEIGADEDAVERLVRYAVM